MTAQIGDIVLLDGKEYEIARFPQLPLGRPDPWFVVAWSVFASWLSFFVFNSIWAAFNLLILFPIGLELFHKRRKHPRIFDLHQKPFRLSAIALSSACQRGYQAEWEIRDQKLYLNEIAGRYMVAGEPIFADWFSGVIFVPQGKVIRESDHLGRCVYERELKFKFRKGVCV